MTNSKKRSRVMSIIIAVAMVFSVFVFMPEDVSAAAKKPGKVKITKATITNQMVEFKWKKVKKAKKYQIFMKKGKGKWKKIKTVNAKTLKFKKNGLKWNTKYYFKFRAVNGKKKGKFTKNYYAKVRKKTTLQKVITAKQENSIRSNFKKQFNDEFFADKDIKITGNAVVMYLGLTLDREELTDSDISGLKNELTTAKFKKAMHSSIIKDQNTVGIVGITYKLQIKTHDGVTIFNYTYK